MRPVTIIATLLLTPLITAASCGNTRPQLPETVEVVVEKYRDLPSWATDPLPIPHPADGTVGERVRSENDRGEVLLLANCHRALLRKIEKGEQVDPKECEQ